MKTCSSPVTLALLFLLVPIIQIKTVDGKKAAAPVPAVFVFRDSIVDPGNNNKLKTATKCNFPPYGRDFSGHRATGRFSNGKIPTDFIISELGIKEFMPAYLDPELNDEELLTGVSFASGGAGYDNLTAALPSVLSLWDQLDLYQDYKRRLTAIAGEERTANIVDKSIYIIFAGSNDLLITYFTTSARKGDYDLPSYVNYMVASASSFLKDLYSLGARRIGIAGVPPLGCVPEQRTLQGGITRECVDTGNQASVKFNSELAMELKRLETILPGSRIIYMDVYNKLLDLILHPSSYGFEESTRGCCGTGEFEATLLCNELNPLTCTDASKYVFWDCFHPTEKAYEILIPPLVQKYLPLIF